MAAVMERLLVDEMMGTEAALRVGDSVEVQNRFDGSWSSGFEVASVLGGVGRRRYRIRRLSDGEVLPVLFVEDALH